MACGRLIEGVGCAMFMPGGVHLVTRLSPPHARGRAIGAFNAAWFAGIAVGPPLGGWLTDVGTGHLGTRLAFYGCAVLSLFTAVAVQSTMSTYPNPLRPQCAVRRLHWWPLSAPGRPPDVASAAAGVLQGSELRSDPSSGPTDPAPRRHIGPNTAAGSDSPAGESDCTSARSGLRATAPT